MLLFYSENDKVVLASEDDGDYYHAKVRAHARAAACAARLIRGRGRPSWGGVRAVRQILKVERKATDGTLASAIRKWDETGRYFVHFLGWNNKCGERAGRGTGRAAGGA